MFGMPNSIADQIGLVIAVIMVVDFLSFGIIYMIMMVVARRISSRIRTPPLTLSADVAKAAEKYHEKKAANPGTEPFIMLPSYGKKTPAVRRRLVLASNTPGHYNTYFGNRRIKLASADAKHEGFDPIKNKPGEDAKKIIFGFFHPYANCGGGGERVLWAAVKATLEQSDRNICVIYTGLDPPPAPVPRSESTPGEFVDINRPDRIMERVKSRFGLEVADPSRIVFIYLANRKFVDPATWPRCTLLLQALGSMCLAYEALTTLVPDIFVDTMGYPFTYPVVSWLADVPIASYVHYPVISSDMIKGMIQGTPRGIWKLAKWLYWTAFAYAYTYVGSYVSIIMTNSTWTCQHMRQQWWYGRGKDVAKHIQIVYPPCATQDFANFKHVDRRPEVVYLAQFRPEKRHELVLNEFAKFLKQYKSANPAAKETPRLVLIGTIRNDSDRSAVYNLRILAHEQKLVDGLDYQFVLDAPWSTVIERLSTAKFGLDAMWNEHFGMVVVEYMAARLVPIVHYSGGPKSDIVIPWSTTTGSDDSAEKKQPTGVHFVSPTDPDYDAAAVAAANPKIGELAETFDKMFSLTEAELAPYTERGWAACQRFSDARFAENWNARVDRMARLDKLRTRSRKADGIYD